MFYNSDHIANDDHKNFTHDHQHDLPISKQQFTYQCLLSEHRALDQKIADKETKMQQIADHQTHHEIMRLKKRKLALKDKIRALEARLTPDIIA